MTQPEHPLRAIAQNVVDHLNSGAQDDSPLWDRHFDPGWTQVELDGQVFEGRAAVEAKNAAFMEAWIIHEAKAEGPFLGTDRFAVICEADMESRDGAFPRMTIREICLYTMKNGKIVREEFLGPPHAM